MTENEQIKAIKIRLLNDVLRKTGQGGFTYFVGDLAQSNPLFQFKVHALVRMDDKPTDGNDPYGEHDFGTVTVDGEDIMWKIDYYDLNGENHSPDPTNEAVTKRILSIFYARDY